MLKIVLGVICAFASGCLLAVPIGMGVNAKWSPFFGAPLAVIMIAGIIVVAVVFFAPHT